MMARKLRTKTFPSSTNAETCTNGHLLTMFDHLADQVDFGIHAKLMSELMVRYAEMSKQLEEKNRALVLSDDARREAQRIAKLGNWSLDIHKQKLWWSDMMYRVLDLDPSIDPNLDAYFQRVHPEDYDRIYQSAIKVMVEGDAPKEHRYRILTKDGRIKWVHTQYVVDHDSSGKPVSVHGTIQDITEQKTAEEKLKRYNTKLEEMVQEKVREISESQMATIYALVKLAESRDDDTGEHIVRTSEYCRLLATALRESGHYTDEIDEAFVENITKASPLHDIGKVGIPDVVLLKPGRLTPEEFDTMKTHVTLGYNTLAMVYNQYPENAFVRVGMDIAQYHHEKWDGSGYNGKLHGTAIPLAARIMAVADVYDALRSKRVYKDAFSHEKSMGIILQGSGNHFDPLLVEVFIQNNSAMQTIFESAHQISDSSK